MRSRAIDGRRPATSAAPAPGVGQRARPPGRCSVGMVERLHDEPVQLVEPASRCQPGELAEHEAQQVQRRAPARASRGASPAASTVCSSKPSRSRTAARSMPRSVDEQGDVALDVVAAGRARRAGCGRRRPGRRRPGRRCRASASPGRAGSGPGARRTRARSAGRRRPPTARAGGRRWEAQHPHRIELARVAAPAIERTGELGQGALEHAGDVEQSHDLALPSRSRREERRWCRRGPTRRGVERRSANQSSRRRPRARVGRLARRPGGRRDERLAVGRVAGRARSARRRCAASRRRRRSVARRRAASVDRGDLVDPPPQQRRRDHRGHQHDEEQGAVQVVVEHARWPARCWRRSGRPRRAGSSRCRSAACRPRVPTAPQRRHELADDRR